MDISYLIQALQNKIIILSNAKAQAYSTGDLDGVNSIDQDLMSTQNTLAQLNLLNNLNVAADAAGMTSTDIVASGVDAAQSDQSSISTVIVDGYDISTYATDPLYADKLQAVLNVIPSFASAGDVNTYVQSIATNSPVTGGMVVAAASTFNIDIRLLMSILQLESQFGTQGVAVSTLNPGNVGNTGSATQTYATWGDGVAAVAEWLSLHRVASVVATTQPASTTVPVSTSTSTGSSTLPIVTIIPTSTSTTTTQTVTTTTVSTSTPLSASSTDALATTTTPSASSTVVTATSTPDADASSTATSTSSSTPIIDIPVPTPDASASSTVATTTTDQQDPSASSTATSTGQ
jgi:hypothetical protein